MFTSNHKKIFFSIFLFLLIQSCKKDVEITSINPIKFPEECEVFKIEEGCYGQMFIIDSFLIMTAFCSLEEDLKRIHVYNKENLQLITKFGTTGLGPYEFPGSIKPLTTIQHSNSISFYDPKIWHFKTINLDKYLLGDNIVNCIISTPMDPILINKDYIKVLDKHQFIGRYNNPDLEGMFFIYDTLNKQMKWIDPVPEVRGVELRNKIYLHDGEFIANSSKNSILYATKFFDQVLFYDFKGNLLKQYVFSPLKKPLFDKRYLLPARGSFMYGISAFATSEYCFVVRWGIRSGSIEPDHPPIPTQLLVFNWDGLFIRAFDEFFGARFCYDEEFGIIYTFDSSKEENDPYITVRKYRIGDYLQAN